MMAMTVPQTPADRLASLQYHWGSAYHIWQGPSSGKWCATRHGDSRRLLRADTAAGLRQLIRADYRDRSRAG